ncbi:hypothetical protein CN345_17605 [Bacillus thuringiensis]|uniref:ATP-grasp domain-containing protein n=1 Tax=Bacillus thuringiensis TaxID=1428 RepID=UPI000BF92D8F|nr:ATP-grasp domain-containing protein [Bacillus thuringiensis]PEZ30939.1 hypothetical protein CN345_17605 [Bacillus thuringiensis]PGY52215.1 hypothetical protein COE09_17050 [Bacillus thuringiensis]
MRLLMLIAKRNTKRGTTKRSTYILHADLAYQHALDKGHEVFLVNAYNENENESYCGRNNSKIFSDPNPFIAVSQALNVDAVVCFSTERTLERDAFIKKELEDKGIPVIANPLEAIQTLSYKEKAKKLFLKNSIPTLQGEGFQDKHELQTLVNRLGFPLIIKRSGFTGGNGNTILKDYNDLNIFINGRECFGEEILIEKFVSGIELAMEIVGNNGHYMCMPLIYKGLTTERPINRLCYAPYGGEIMQETIKQIALKIAKELNLCGCAELKVVYEPHSNAIYVLDVSPRTSGTTLLTMAYTNISIPKVLIDIADNTWNNSLPVTTGKISIEIDLISGIPQSVFGEIYALPTFFECSRHNKDGQCVKFILNGNTSSVIADMEKVKSLKVSTRLKDSSDFHFLLQSFKE